MILIGAVAALHILSAPDSQAVPSHALVTPLVRRIAATTQLAAQEYRIGVVGGRVVAAAEVEEARLFLVEARRSADQLPGAAAARAGRELDEVLALVARSGPPDTVAARVRALAEGLAGELHVELDEIPEQAPRLARGAEVFRSRCAACHGSLGAGDGPQAAGLSPRPANLADRAALADVTPLDFYRRVTFGVVGTAMPAFEAELSAEDRWAVAAYATLLRLPPAAGDVPPALTVYPTTARMSDIALAGALGGRTDDPATLARVAAVRSLQPAEGGTADAVIGRVRTQVDEAIALAGQGRFPDASARAFDAYMTFERVERDVRAKAPALAGDLETAFASLRTRSAGGATVAELQGIRATLLAGLEKAERVLGDSLSPLNLFVQSFVLLVREGLEAILILGALLTFLVKTGAQERKRDIHVGVGAALGASVVTAVLLETVVQLTPGKRESVEGGTMLVAAAVLFYVSYWLISKMEVARWTQFVKSRVQDAVTSGSALALASAAFLAVYREGFETVLFYKALFVSGGPGATVLPVALGMVAGAVVLGIVYWAMNRFGVKLPLKPFFGVTGAFLYYMAFVFAGRGVAEVQEGGLIGTTVLPWAPRIPALGVYPTLESLLAQGLLAGLFVGALLWTFVIRPRRERLAVTPVLVPGPVEAARAAAREGIARASVDPETVVGEAEPAAAGQRELIRSLERMEADLAAVRAEVERMRDQLAKQADRPGSGRR